MKKEIMVAAALLLTGCSTSPKGIAEQQKKAQTEEALQWCVDATDIATKTSHCFGALLLSSDPELYSKGHDHWMETVAKMPPDKRLLAAVLASQIPVAKEAIVSGANINREFTHREVYGSDAHEPERKITALNLAIMRSTHMAVLLMQQGADPNWRADGEQSDMFSRRLTGTRLSISDVKMAEQALKYGLVPTAYSLIELEIFMRDQERRSVSTPSVKSFYVQLVQRTPPAVKREYAALTKTMRLEEEQREKEEQKRNAQLTERKRIIGTRICKEIPSQYGTVRYVGYVEGLGPEKVQIRVSSAVFKNAPSLAPGSFRENITWDYPANWDICE